MDSKRLPSAPQLLSLVVILSFSTAGCTDPGPTADTAAASSPASAAEEPDDPEGPPALSYPAEEIPAGRNTTGLGSEVPVSFEVPEGWWGEQSGGNAWVLGWGPVSRPSRTKVALWVEELAYPFREALTIFKKIDRIDAGRPTSLRVDARRAAMFAAEVEGKEHVPLEALGTGGDIRWDLELRQVFIDLDGTTMLVRIELRGDNLKRGLEVLRSFRIDA